MLKKQMVAMLFVLGAACSFSQDVTVSKVFNVDADTSSTGGVGPDCTTITQTIDLSTSPGFSELKDHIQSLKLNSVALTVVNPNLTGTSVATTVNGTVSIGDPTATPLQVGTYAPLALTAGTSEDLTITGDPSTVLTTTALTAPYTVPVNAQGCVDQFPAHFSVQMDLDADVTVKL
jgi:hypothetical protein